jgi:hypothetical protein
MVSR